MEKRRTKGELQIGSGLPNGLDEMRGHIPVQTDDWSIAAVFNDLENKDEGIANAEFMCKAWNNYDTLLDTLKESYEELKFHNWHNSTTGLKINSLIESLSK